MSINQNKKETKMTPKQLIKMGMEVKKLTKRMTDFILFFVRLRDICF